VAKDQDLEPASMKKDLASFQDPAQADNLTKIQQDLDEIKNVMHKNITDLFERGETLEVRVFCTNRGACGCL
jgi:synaptobrevin family protein YKT6